MITRRALLKGLAGGAAVSVAAATLVRTADKPLGWPFRKGLTIDDLPPDLPPAVPAYLRFGDDNTGFYSWCPHQITLVAGGVEVFAG